MGVSGEVDVDLVFRLDPRLAAAGAAALDAEYRAEGWLAQRGRDALAEPAKSLREADGGGCLALPGACGRHAGDHDELAARPAFPYGLQTDLGLVAPVGNNVLLR